MNKWQEFIELLMTTYDTYLLVVGNGEDAHFEIVVGTPAIYEEDPQHFCGTCGAELEIVRPGKYQCPNCE